MNTKTINRRQIMITGGALIGTAAIGFTRIALAKTPAFDPARFIRECESLGYQNMMCIQPDGRKGWYTIYPSGPCLNGETERYIELISEANTTPGAKKQIIEYLLKTGRAVEMRAAFDPVDWVVRADELTEYLWVNHYGREVHSQISWWAEGSNATEFKLMLEELRAKPVHYSMVSEHLKALGRVTPA